METENILTSLEEGIERLNAAASTLEQAAARLGEKDVAETGSVEKLTATVESHGEMLQRERALLEKLEAAEQQIAQLRAQAGVQTSTQAARMAGVRQTLPASTVQLLAKQGLSEEESMQTGTLDTALSGLSLEQRIAVKAQLHRAGMLAL